MPRRFNTAGPNDPEEHYTLPVLLRLPDVRRLVDAKRYFVLHAPRRAGRTTALLTLARALTREGLYAVVLVSMDGGAPFGQDLGMAEDAILDAWRGAASRRLPPDLRPPPWPAAPPGRRLGRALQAWAEAAPRPLVVLLDDLDILQGAALTSALCQIGDGFPDRPHHFPWSLAVAGTRDMSDGEIAAGAAGLLDIMSESVTLRDFTRDEVAELYGQHTGETGQAFLPAAIDRAFELTRGQPQLVNVLARQLVEVLVPDGATAITAAHVDAAGELLVPRQAPPVPDERRAQQAPASEVMPGVVALPSMPPEAHVTDQPVTPATPERPGRHRRTVRIALIAGAACALLATIARIVGGGGGSVVGPHGVAATAADSTPAPLVAPPETLDVAAAPSATTAASASASADPRPRRATRDSPSAPVAAPASASPVDPDAEPRPLIRVLTGLPPLPPPDEARMRPQLEAKVWGGDASVDEIRMLRAICSRMGDRACRDRAIEVLQKRQNP